MISIQNMRLMERSMSGTPLRVLSSEIGRSIPIAAERIRSTAIQLRTKYGRDDLPAVPYVAGLKDDKDIWIDLITRERTPVEVKPKLLMCIYLALNDDATDEASLIEIACRYGAQDSRITAAAVKDALQKKLIDFL